jgi:hypothetical protein
MSHPWSLAGNAPVRSLQTQGFAMLAPEQLTTLAGLPRAALAAWLPLWDRLAPDEYLRDGGRYRSRRHSCYIQEVSGGGLILAPPRPHFQSTDYNALHGGIDRWFEPLEAGLVQDPAWAQLLTSLGGLFGRVAGIDRWYIEAHQFRIDARDGVGRPTPEGAHRDGVDYVAVIVANRQDVKGGETRVFQAHGPLGMRFLIEEPWSALLLDDARVIHETTPIQPAGPAPVRDTLVLTYRRGGFQAADQAA